MGLFDIIKSGLQKTRDALVSEVNSIMGSGKLTDEMLDELEEKLIRNLVSTLYAVTKHCMGTDDVVTATPDLVFVFFLWGVNRNVINSLVNCLSTVIMSEIHIRRK